MRHTRGRALDSSASNPSTTFAGCGVTPHSTRSARTLAMNLPLCIQSLILASYLFVLSCLTPVHKHAHMLIKITRSSRPKKNLLMPAPSRSDGKFRQRLC